MSYKYLHFEEVETLPEKKTKRFLCLSSTGSVLGNVKWFGRWRQYCFYPAPETIFSTGCLDDIKDFILKLQEERKQTSSNQLRTKKTQK